MTVRKEGMPARRLSAPPKPTEVAVWLGLAASPTFTVMALVSATGAQEMATCLPVEAPAVNGMAVMYLLMSLFHTPHWLTLAAGSGPFQITSTKVKPKGSRP